MRAFPATINRTVVFGSACWVLSIVFFVIQAIAQAASARPFSLRANLISDLGNTACGADVCSPLHSLVNATFVFVGVLHGLGAVTTYRAWPHPRQGGVGLVFLVAAGAGLAIAGLAPQNENATSHAIGALSGLISLNLAMILLGSILLDAVRWLGVLTEAAGVVGFIGFGMFRTGAGGMPVGVAERIADYPGAGMVIVLGTFILMSIALARRRTVGQPAALAGPR